MSQSQVTFSAKYAGLSDHAGLWLIEPLAARLLCDVVSRLDSVWRIVQQPPEPMSLTQMVETRNGKTVAVIQVGGVLMKNRPLWGGTSTLQLARDIHQAANDPGVAAILLQVDSPGGTVAGIEDLAAEIKAAGKAKPVWTQVEDILASAAYWAASQTSQIFANSSTTLVGSIGAYLTVYDTSKAAKQQGVRTLHFTTGPLKGAGQMGTVVTPEQESFFQSIIDGVQAEFDRAVRSGRGFTVNQLEAVRTGGVWKAPEAQARGLIDGVQPISRTIEQLSRAATERQSSKRRTGAFATPARTGLPTTRGVSL